MKPVQAVILELERELRMREHVYPRLILVGKLPAATAVHRKECMEQAIAHLKALLNTAPRHGQAPTQLG